jgi:Na+-driven multidrug efflux pump
VAADGITGLIYQVIIAFYSGCISFTGQCMGAKKHRRIDQMLLVSCATCCGILLVVNLFSTFWPELVLTMFNSDPEVIEAGRGILMINSWGYMLYAVCDLVLCCSRGMGKTSVPTILSFAGICVPRILWAMVVFPFFRTVEFLFLCYPISWFINSVLQIIYYVRVRKQVDQKATLRLQKQETEKLSAQ